MGLPVVFQFLEKLGLSCTTPDFDSLSIETIHYDGKACDFLAIMKELKDLKHISAERVPDLDAATAVMVEKMDAHIRRLLFDALNRDVRPKVIPKQLMRIYEQ